MFGVKPAKLICVINHIVYANLLWTIGVEVIYIHPNNPFEMGWLTASWMALVCPELTL